MAQVTWKKLGRIEWAAFVDGVQVATVWSAGVESRGSRSLKSNSWRGVMQDGSGFVANTREQATERIALRLASQQEGAAAPSDTPEEDTPMAADPIAEIDQTLAYLNFRLIDVTGAKYARAVAEIDRLSSLKASARALAGLPEVDEYEGQCPASCPGCGGQGCPTY